MDIHDPGLASHPGVKPPVRRAYGTGKFPHERIPVPAPLSRFNRPYHRYGLPPDLVEKNLKRIPAPAAVLVTSMMTYWYPAVKDLIRLVRKIHPGVPVILGGIYATLCPEHASSVCGADLVVTGNDPNDVTKALSRFGIEAPGAVALADHPYPAFDMLRKIDYICLLTTRGCPFSCRYCASSFLQPRFIASDPQGVVEEIQYWHDHHSVKDFAFYDDALLVNSTVHIEPLLEEILRRNLNVRFHTPNALHAAAVTKPLARLMRRAGFRTIRIGLETSDFSFRANLDNKMQSGDIERAAACFADAGFPPHELGAYILAGLPGQTPSSVKETIVLAGRLGFMPFLAEYSPLPHTALWEEAVACAGDELREEPLLQNNTILSCWEAHRGEMPRLRQLVKEVRASLRKNS
jgi:radical SAM superfamily enzyme YgiQ (UPF0313 family)